MSDCHRVLLVVIRRRETQTSLCGWRDWTQAAREAPVYPGNTRECRPRCFSNVRREARQVTTTGRRWSDVVAAPSFNARAKMAWVPRRYWRPRPTAALRQGAADSLAPLLPQRLLPLRAREQPMAGGCRFQVVRGGTFWQADLVARALTNNFV